MCRGKEDSSESFGFISKINVIKVWFCDKLLHDPRTQAFGAFSLLALVAFGYCYNLQAAFTGYKENAIDNLEKIENRYNKVLDDYKVMGIFLADMTKTKSKYEGLISDIDKINDGVFQKIIQNNPEYLQNLSLVYDLQLQDLKGYLESYMKSKTQETSSLFETLCHEKFHIAIDMIKKIRTKEHQKIAFQKLFNMLKGVIFNEANYTRELIHTVSVKQKISYEEVVFLQAESKHYYSPLLSVFLANLLECINENPCLVSEELYNIIVKNILTLNEPPAYFLNDGVDKYNIIKKCTRLYLIRANKDETKNSIEYFLNNRKYLLGNDIANNSNHLTAFSEKLAKAMTSSIYEREENYHKYMEELREEWKLTQLELGYFPKL